MVLIRGNFFYLKCIISTHIDDSLVTLLPHITHTFIWNTYIRRTSSFTSCTAFNYTIELHLHFNT